ncbi:MAG: hypothetical protein ACRDZ4_14095 [Egibacteraceae bacterium]
MGEVSGVVERVSVASVLDGHVTLAVDCFDRLYVNAYVPTLQTPGAVVRFLTEHRGNPIPSPALFNPIGNAFRRAVKTYAADHDVPVVKFAGHERKLDVVRPFLTPGEPGVRVIGHAQEFQRVWVGGDARRDPTSGVPHYAFAGCTGACRSSTSISCAPRGALSYPRLSWEGFGGAFLGLMAYPDSKEKGNNSMPAKQRTSRR